MTLHSEPGHLPYPEGTDAADGPAQFEALTDRIAVLLAAVTEAQRDALAGTDRWTGRQVFNTDSGLVEVWDGAAWESTGVTSHADLTNLTTGDPHTQYVTKALFDANSLLKADANDVPEALPVAEQRLVGRITGGEITDLTGAQSFGILTAEVAAAIAGRVKAVRKTADESVTSSTVYQSDDHLLFAIAANETWVADFMLIVTGDTSGDIRTQFTVPAGATVSVAGFGPAAGATASAYDGIWFGDAATGVFGQSGTLVTATMPLFLRVIVANGATAGNVTLQWAQGTSSGTATVVKAGSSLIAVRV